MLRHAFLYMAAHAVSALLGLAMVVIFTRLLTPAEYGFYIICMSIAGIASAVLFAWIKVSILRFESEGEGTDIRLTALFGFLIALVVSPVIVVVTVYAAGETWATATIAVGLALALGAFEFGQEILRARQRAYAYSFSAAGRAVLAMLLSLGLYWWGLAGLSLVLGVAGAYLLTSLMFAGIIWQPPLNSFNPAFFRQMLRFGIPMAIAGIVFSLHSALDRLIIGYFLGEAAAGVYGASADLVRQIVLFPATAIAAAVIPAAIKAYANDTPEAAERQMIASGELLMGVIAPTVVGLSLVSSHISGIILGPDFREAALYLMPILAFVWMFQVFNQQFVHVSFHIAKIPRFLAIQGTIVLVVNMVLMALMVPSYGLRGAAWSLLISEAIGVGIGYMLASKAQPLPLMLGSMGRISAATVAMAIPTALVLFYVEGYAGFVAAVVLGMAVYGVAAIVLDIAGIKGALRLWLNREKPLPNGA